VTAPGAPPRVSVIVRTKDRPALLAEALASLRAQRFQDFETLLVNSGSVLERASLGPSPGLDLRAITPERTKSRANALNAGLAAARGIYVAYLDDDDLYRPSHLERLVVALDGDDACGAAFSSVDQIAQRREPDGRYRDAETLYTYGRPFDANRILYKNDVPLVALMHRRDLVEKTGPFDEAFDLYEDWDFLIRLSEVTRLRFVPETTAVYRLRDDGTNATTAAPWRGAEAEAARKALYAKHAARRTPEAAMAVVDGFDEEAFLREGEVKDLRSRLAQAADRLARLESDLRAVRAESAARQAALANELDALRRSRWFRLASRWWKLKAFLSR
jgi:glycosyltransferase involved in cell wall biosynthesis